MSARPIIYRFMLSLMLIPGFSTSSYADILDAPRKLATHSFAWVGPLEGPSKNNNGYRMNMGFIVGNKAIAVIDSGYTPAMANEMVAHIQRISSVPIRYVINTNSQPHRFMGNTVFEKLGAVTLAHPVESQRIQRRAGDFAGAIERVLELPKDSVVIPGVPDKQVDKKTTLDLGGITIDISPMPASHTGGSLIVSVPVDKIIYAGDILYSGRLLAVLEESDVTSWLQCYDRLKSLGRVKLVPGHGEPAYLSAFDQSTRAYLQHLETNMKRMVDEGIALQDAINQLDQGQWKDLANFKELAGRNASWTYLEKERKSFE